MEGVRNCGNDRGNLEHVISAVEHCGDGVGAQGFASSGWFELSATAGVVAGTRKLVVEVSARAAMIFSKI